MRAVREYAYAKVNLFLDCRRVREDGFHGVESVMHAVGLHDELTVTLGTGSGISLECQGGGYLPTDSRNLAYRAAELMLDRLGISGSVKITLKKNIPVSAGLAGGSTDAAAVLRALNRLLGRPMSRSGLLSLGAELGSDVPFCILGGTAFCEGRGEVVTPLPDLSLNFVVAKADERVCTKEAYALLDSHYNNFEDGSSPDSPVLRDGLLRFIRGGDAPGALFNVFEDAILPTVGGARTIKEKMLSLGAKYAMLSGSGPSVFGIFDTEQMAKAAEREISRMGFFASACKSAT